MNGMDPMYTRWIFHGEEPRSSVQDEYREMPETYFMYRDAFLQDDDVVEPTQDREELDFKILVDDAELPLYTGCSYIKMSAIVVLYKARHSLTDIAFDELLHGFLPRDNRLPNYLYATKKLLNDFGLGYEKIHACVQDCCLFRKRFKGHSSQWKINERTKKIQQGVPAKILRYFPTIPRFRRMFKSLVKPEQLT